MFGAACREPPPPAARRDMADRDSTSMCPAGGAGGGGGGAGGAGGAGRHVETAALIELVRARPCLWDRGAPSYRLRQEKERAWREVYRDLEPAYDAMTRAQRKDFGLVICRRWANIRDSYKKYLKGTHRTTASRPYLYADNLGFLDAIYGEVRGKTEYEENEQEAEGEPQEWLNEVFVDMDTREGGGQPKRARLDYPRSKDALEAEENIVSVLVGLIEKEDDEDRAFFKSITPAVKSLPDGDKLFFRIQVMKLLDSMKRKTAGDAKKDKTTLERDSE